MENVCEAYDNVHKPMVIKELVVSPSEILHVFIMRNISYGRSPYGIRKGISFGDTELRIDIQQNLGFCIFFDSMSKKRNEEFDPGSE